MSELKRKIVLEGEKAREAVLKGINANAAIVAKTLGPKGRNVLVDYGPNRVPRVINDGVTIAEYLTNRTDLSPPQNLAWREFF